MNINNEMPENLDFSGVRFTSNEIILLDENRIAVQIQKETVKHIALKYGFLSKHPIIQALFGAGLTVIGYFPLKFFIHWIKNGGNIMDATIMLIFAIPMGVWVVYNSSARGFYLEIIENKRFHKFGFSDKPSLNNINRFLMEISNIYNYEINH